MAWQYPTHSCGHTGERYQAYGHHSGRERELERIESHPCPSCRAAEAQEQGKAGGLPALTGSDKQIAWAGDIRAGMVRAGEQLLTELRSAPASGDGEEKKARAVGAAEGALVEMRGHTDARWWIDHRNEAVVREAARRALLDVTQLV